MAPAVALGTIQAINFDNDSLVLVLPADHAINNTDKFNEIINKGIQYAEEGYIVSFGIPPTCPETGFGYIEAEEPLDKKDIKGIKIKKKLLKSLTRKLPEKLILNEKYSWNSGIFLMRSEIAFKQFSLFVPELISQCEDCIKNSSVDLDFIRIPKDKFSAYLPNIPFDIAIMEKTELGVVLPLNVEWSDVGNWEALWQISKDMHGNALMGNVLSEKIKNCYMRSDNKLLVGIDIEDLIIVETDDAVLISKKGSSQKLKNIVDKMKKEILKALIHKEIFRPWGSYISLSDGSGWQVKRINVKPGASLSSKTQFQNRALDNSKW